MNFKTVLLFGSILLTQSIVLAETVQVPMDRASYDYGFQMGLRQGQASCVTTPQVAQAPRRQVVSQSCRCQLYHGSRSHGEVVVRTEFSDNTSESRTIHTNVKTDRYKMFGDTCESLADSCNQQILGRR